MADWISQIFYYNVIHYKPWWIRIFCDNSNETLQHLKNKRSGININNTISFGYLFFYILGEEGEHSANIEMKKVIVIGCVLIGCVVIGCVEMKLR